MEYTKIFVEDAINRADAFSAGNFGASIIYPNLADILLVAVQCDIKEKYIVLLNEFNFNQVDFLIAKQNLLHRFDLRINNNVNRDNFLIFITKKEVDIDNSEILIYEKFIYGNFTTCQAALIC